MKYTREFVMVVGAVALVSCGGPSRSTVDEDRRVDQAMRRVEAEQNRTDDVQREKQRTRAGQQTTQSRGNHAAEEAPIQAVDPVIVQQHVPAKSETTPHFDRNATGSPSVR